MTRTKMFYRLYTSLRRCALRDRTENILTAKWTI